MCGISGIFNITQKSLEAKSIIENILKIQNTRGPDDQNIWFSDCDKITFGHNRLSILDRVNKESINQISYIKIILHRHWLVFIIIILLLTLEWVYKRKIGMI